MLIDWFTVGAQALNFLILVWLMKRFLYKPILHAIDAREKRIAAELADADAKKAEAQKERDEFQHKNEEFDQQRAALLSKATDEAQGRTSAAPRRSAEGGRCLECQTAGSVEKRRTEPDSSHQPPDPAGSICHRTKGADGSRHDESGRTPGRGVRPACACHGRRGEGAVGDGLQDVEPGGERAQRVRPAAGATRGDTKCAQRNFLGGNLTSGSRPRRTWSAASNSPRMDKRWPGASRIIWRRWKRVPANFCTRGQARSQAGSKVQAEAKAEPSPSQRPKPSPSQ